MSWRKLIGLALICLSLIARSREVVADELSEEDAARAFQQGLAAFDEGKPELAVSIWRPLLATASPDRAWRIHYNLGLAYEAMGDRPKAIESFEQFSRRVGEQPGSLPIAFEERRQDAVERAARLRPFVALLRVNAPVSGEAINVTIGGESSRPAGFASYLEPGTVRLVMGEGERAVTQEFELTAGELRTITARQLPAPPPPAPAPPPPYEPPIPNALLIVLGAASTAGLALPVGLYVRATSLRDEAGRVPSFDPRYQARLADYEDARSAYQLGYALPAGLAGVALSLLVVNVVHAQTSSRGVPNVDLGASADGPFLRLLVRL